MCCIIAHRSPPVDQQNSSSSVETEDPAVGTKRARMTPGSKIVLPSSDVMEYSGNTLRSIISRIVNPTSKLLIPPPILARAKNSHDYLQMKAAEKSTRVRIVQVGGQTMCCFLLY